LTENFARVGSLWVSVEPNIRYHGHLSQMFLNFSVSHGMWVLCSLWNAMKSCVSLCHHLKQGQYYYQKCVVILYNGTCEVALM